MPIYTLDTLTTKYNTLGEQDIRMNEYAPAIRATVTQEEAQHESIVIIRPSFKKICDGEPCRAALFNHILYWIARKRKSGIDYWYSTGDGLYHDLAESWGVTQVRREVKALINSNLVGVLKNPRMAIDRTKHFFFQSAQAAVFFAKCAAEKICFACIGLCREVIDLLNAPTKDEAIDSSIKCLCAQHQEHLMELSKPFDKSITPITQVSYSESVNPNESVSEDISFTVVNDELRPYIDGYQDQSQMALLEWLERETNARFPDIPPSLPLTLAQEAQLYTSPVEMVCTSDNDTHSHIVKATRKKASKPKPEPAAPPTIQLTEQQQAFWLLWCDIWFNQDIPPELNDTAYKHVKKLSPLIKTKEQLEDLIKHARVEMEASGFKRKVVHLGNLVNSYPGWKQQSRPIAPGVAVPQNFTGMGRLLHIKPQEANRGQTFTS